MKTKYLPFDAFSVPLEDINLIEASAGTGKTYSITLLVLRILLEKNIPIQEILMVTFTNAAAAELEIRIRHFIRRAHQLATSGVTHAEKGIDREIIKIFAQAPTDNDKTIEEKLSDAMLFMDELKVMTIHGFCQKTLQEYALETGQLFGSKINNDLNETIEREIQRFWRARVATLPPFALKLLRENKWEQSILHDATSKIIEGYEVEETPFPGFEELEALYAFQQHLDEHLHDFIETHFEAYVEANSGQKCSRAASGKACKEKDPSLLHKGLQKALTNAKEYETCMERSEIERYAPLYEWLQFAKEKELKLREKTRDLMNALLYRFQEEGIPMIEAHKNKNAILTFSDLTRNLYRALNRRPNPGLVRKLQWTYKAVFIDEFQDTDHWQYGIFKTAFHQAPSPLVFYIGDPKQLIYSWRGADLEMYKQAVQEIPRRYSMSVNYRSAPSLIAALNAYFPTGKGCTAGALSSPFCDESVRYLPVTAGKKDLGALKVANEVIPPLEVIKLPEKSTKEEALEYMVHQTAHLLNNGAITQKNGTTRPVKPQDIAILTRGNKEGLQLKMRLARVGIPAIVIDETKVLTTETAVQLHYLLIALLDLTPGNIRRALYSPLTPQYANPEVHPDLGKHAAQLSACKRIWLESGVFSALQHFLAIYAVRHHLLEEQNPMGERIYSNLIQLLEILNHTEHFEQLSPEKLTDWLGRAIENPPNISEYEQRLETDNLALRISTVHKSKGLQYNIVLLPHFNLPIPRKTNSISELVSYRDENQSYKLCIGYPNATIEEQKLLERQAEDRRLFYVAMTRAIYAVFLQDTGKSGLLGDFTVPEDTALARVMPPVTVDKSARYKAPHPPQYPRNVQPFEGDTGVRLSVTSYSALDTHQHQSIRTLPPETWPTLYDRFIFNDLGKGPQIGTFLHDILEHIDFGSMDHHPKVIDRALSLFGIPLEENKEGLYEMVEHITRADIRLDSNSFVLADIPNPARLNELEFFFDFKRWDLASFPAEGGPLQSMRIAHPGIMHGYIDLMFEHGGKYYILDWKSNHLGYHTDDYDRDGLLKAMVDNNYTLQYHVYALAATRYLRAQLPAFDYQKHFGGVIYLFIRGARKGQTSGVFTALPKESTLEWLEKMAGE